MDADGVSIVIPNWNHEVFLPRSIASALRGVEVLRQAGLGGEVLVIDDQSRDGSVALLRQLEALNFGRGLRVLWLSKNQGLAAARNHGLGESRHRFVVLMDADNELVPESLPSFVRALRETGAAAAYGNLLYRGYGEPEASGVMSNRSLQDEVFRANYIDAFSIVDRIQLLDAGRYDASCVAHEDYEMWLHLACNGRKIVFVPMVLGYYYANPGSMIKDLDQNQKANGRVTRMYDQVGARSFLPLETRFLRYHPELGYL